MTEFSIKFQDRELIKTQESNVFKWEEENKRRN